MPRSAGLSRAVGLRARARGRHLSVTGFVLGQQDITSLPGFEEKFDVTAAQVTLADLEHRTGLGFGALESHGRFKIRPLTALEDIVV